MCWASDGVHVDSPSAGDVVFFEDTYNTGGASHSGIYIGNNQMIHAGTEDTGVEMTNMNIDYWQNRYLGAKSFQ
nr:NlpC/P60 family protein [Lentibacillus sp. CBA3610]